MDKSIIVGVDVSKGWLDLAAAGGGQVERLDNTSEAITCAEMKGRFETECKVGRFCDKYAFKAALLTLKNMILTDLQWQLVDQIVLVIESWEDTMSACDVLPDWASLTPEHQDQFGATYCYRQLVDWRRWGFSETGKSIAEAMLASRLP